MIFEDQLAALEADSKRVGTQGQEIDFALLVDGLAAEREQGITIDVAYRFFATEKRKFIVADTPGHEQYTRNMVTGASTADLAVILIDARKGVLTQTRRHSYLAHLLGIRHIVLAVNKMDLVGYDQATSSTRSSPTIRAFADRSASPSFTAIPISGFKGDNIAALAAPTCPGMRPDADRASRNRAGRRTDAARPPFRMPVQWVNRPNLDFRGFAGLIASGTVRRATRSACCPRARPARRAHRHHRRRSRRSGRGPVGHADPRRRDRLLARRRHRAADNPPQVADQFEATIVWMADERCCPAVLLAEARHADRLATVHAPKYQVNVNTLEHLAAKTLASTRSASPGHRQADRLRALCRQPRRSAASS
jgi:bifunctional enzyme CysN/CysC